MTQNLPNAPTQETRTSSGYAAAFDGKMALWSGIEIGGNAILDANTTGSGNSNDVTDDTVFVNADSNGGVVNVNVSAAQEIDGRVLIVNDANQSAASNTITINTASTINGSASDRTITTSGATDRLVYDANLSDWVVW